MRRFALLGTLALCTFAAQVADRWTVAQNSHFEVYSQSGDGAARKAIAWFEALRIFFRQNGFSDQGRPALRVIGFRSQKEYEEYRLRPIADAYYASDGAHDYIVMASLDPSRFATAAHEYAHYILHAGGLRLPACLNEGVAEFFSTLRLNAGGYELGGDLPGRGQTLRTNRWWPLAELLAFSVPEARKDAEIFYAESWLLADMLMTSPQYSPHFVNLMGEFSGGSNALNAFRVVYGKSLEEVGRDLENWVGHQRLTRFVPNVSAEWSGMKTSDLSVRQMRFVLAQLSLVNGHLEQARSQYEALLPGTPDLEVRAALGVIALRQGNREEALKQWKLAVTDKVGDAELCYRYALLAEDAGLDIHDVRRALERAVALAPGFDDARYKLALIEKNAGEYNAAVEQLRAMRVPSGERRYVYWSALASALTELDKRDEAKEAAGQAEKAAQTEAERSQARQLAYIAETDLKVQFASDSEGHMQMVTTRAQHGTTDWNPFVEPSDHMRRATGKLSVVLCTAGKLSGFLLRTVEGPVTVEVPDPLHVMMRNGPGEFFCGRMPEKAVEADYAIVGGSGRTRNILRGMSFQ